jgi:hypothetical protein
MRRYQSATADAKDTADTLADETPGTGSASASADEAASKSGVNGRVTTPGRK